VFLRECLYCDSGSHGFGTAAVVHQYEVSKWIISDGGESIDMTAEGGIGSNDCEIPGLRLPQIKRQKARRAPSECFQKKKIIQDF